MTYDTAIELFLGLGIWMALIWHFIGDMIIKGGDRL